MRPLILEIPTAPAPESLVERLHGEPGVVVLRSAFFDSPQARYSFVAARPFLTFRSFGSRCEVTFPETVAQGGVNLRAAAAAARCLHPPTCHRGYAQFGNPWQMLDALMARYELLDEIDLPFPVGGCFGYWGYDLKNFLEPKLPRRAVRDLALPDCHTGFYDSLVAFDHHLGKTWILATGLTADGSRCKARAQAQAEFWRALLTKEPAQTLALARPLGEDEPPGARTPGRARCAAQARALFPVALEGQEGPCQDAVSSNLTRAGFLARVGRALRYIRAGDIYQVNLSHRLSTPCPYSGWELFGRLLAVSPAPFAAYLDGGDFQIASSSPEQFLRLSGSHIQTRPIKGTRPRAADPVRDAQLAHELRTSTKEMAELVMITDLLRNDLGKACEFGSVQVPDLARLEPYPQVQHLVSTVEGRLRGDLTHLGALASCFPGGSITGAPKFRAMEIIDELEPVARGPYTGALGYLGFNRESQFNILIRTAICQEGVAHFQVGAGIVADSLPEAEYDETLAKARGFLDALRWEPRREGAPVSRPEPDFSARRGPCLPL